MREFAGSAQWHFMDLTFINARREIDSLRCVNSRQNAGWFFSNKTSGYSEIKNMTLAIVVLTFRKTDNRLAIL